MHTSLLSSMQKALCVMSQISEYSVFVSRIHSTVFMEIIKCAAIFPIKPRDIRSHQIQNILKKNFDHCDQGALLKCFSAVNIKQVMVKLFNIIMVEEVCI